MKHLLRTTQPYLYHIGTSLLLSCLLSLTIWGYCHTAHLFSRAGPPVRLFVANAECGVNVRIPSTPSCVSGKLILGGHRRWQPHFRLVAALPDLTLPTGAFMSQTELHKHAKPCFSGCHCSSPPAHREFL